MDSLLAGTLILPWRVHCAGVMSSAAVPVEIIPAIAKAIPESGEIRSPSRWNRCSPSARNRVRLHPGTLFAFTLESCSPSSGIRTIAKKHVRPTKYRADRLLYHLGSKPLYELIGETDNRNRRQHQVFTIKCRVMALDYVLQHRDCRFLATAREKIDFFCGELNTDRAHLPVKQYRAASGSNITDRFFVDKFPIYVREGDAGVSFSYVDEGLHSTSGFEGYLLQYEGLFRDLPECHIVYVAAFLDQFSKARRVFERFVASRSGPPPLDPQVGRLLRYFRDRNAYDLRDLKDFTQAKLIQFREDRNEFSAVEYERMFEDWKHGGDDVVLSRFGAQKASATRSLNAAFCTHRLPFNYQLFGTLGNGNWQGRAVS